MCPSACNESTWTASLVVSDSGHSGLAALQLQKGEGILTLLHRPPAGEDRVGEAQPGPDQPHRDRITNAEHSYHHHHHHHNARLKKGDSPLNVSELVLDSSQPLWVRYTSSCCSAQAELLVWDAAGNLKRCHLMSGQQRQKRNRNAGTSGAGHIRITGIFFLLLGLLWSFLLELNVIINIL